MSFAGIPFGSGTFAGAGLTSTVPGGGSSGEVSTEVTIDPFTIEISGVSMKGYQMVDSLTVDTELGRQGTARFSLVNLWYVPLVGEPIRILFYNDVIFAGAIDRVSVQTNNIQTFVQYDCDCTDNSYLLFRAKIKLTYTNQTVSAIAANVILNVLNGDSVTVGTVDNNFILPLADADGVSAFDFLNGIAVATGTVFSIDKDKRLNFIGESVVTANTPLTADNVEQARVEFDRETYRNWMTTKATGTPATADETANTIELLRINADQVFAREQIERNSGRYVDRISITHPSSNNPTELARLANAYNKVQLAVAGSIRRSLSIRTREYGYLVGQQVNVNIPQLGVTGDWIIQRLSLQEQSGMFLISNLQLNQTSLLRRSQELWVEVVRKGTLAIMPPISVYTQSISDATTGSGSIVVPAGVTEMQFTLKGAGGGGGGGARSDWPGYGGINQADGSNGGSGGLVVAVITVTPGETLSYFIGTGGTPGPGEFLLESFDFSFGGHGTSGTESWLKRGSTYLARAYGGDYGYGGSCRSRPLNTSSMPPGRDGGGIGGQSVTVGGAGNGGQGGKGATASAGTSGGNGYIMAEW